MKRTFLPISLLLTLPLFGCHSNSKAPQTQLFTPDADAAQLSAFYNAQAAGAEHEDSSLYGADFTADSLNSSGKAKLDLLLSGCEHKAVTEIYLSAANDSPEHRDAIAKYFKCHGVKTDQYAIVSGTNPDSYTMAAQSIKDLETLNGSSSSGADAGSSTGASAGAGMAGGLGGATGSK